MKQIILFFFINIFFTLFCIKFSLDRVFYNLDYLFVFLCVYFNLRFVSFFLLLLFLLIDYLLLVGQIFPFIQLADLLYIFKFIFLSSQLYISIILGVFLVTFIFCFFYSRIKINKEIIIYLLISLLIVNFSSQIAYNKSIVFSGIFELYLKQNQSLSQALSIDENHLIITKPVGSTKKIYSSLKNGTPLSRKILLIVNESLGKPKNPKVLDEIIKPILDRQKNMSFFKKDELGWDSATVYGEMRELCHAQPENLNIKNIQKGFEGCLPNVLKEKGYKSKSYHAALGSMYDRYLWYKKVGFDELKFYESKTWKNYCYSFPGGCDDEILSDINYDFSQNEKKFIYYLTLNTHSPYDLRDLKKDIFDCQKFNINIKTQSCRNFKLQAQFFSNLAIILDSLEMKGVEVYIVGDHTPPIFDSKEKELYFDKNNVVILNFKIK